MSDTRLDRQVGSTPPAPRPDPACGTGVCLDAIEARRVGDFERAAVLFAEAAALATDTRVSLDLRIRQACCLLSVERSAEAAVIAADVAHHARAEGHLIELADALAVVVDHMVRSGQLAEASHTLSEVVDVLDHVPDTTAAYQVIHNVAATHEHSGFYETAIGLFERAMALAGSDEERAFTRASMTSAFHFAAARATDPDERERLLTAGLVAARDIEEASTELLTVCAALAHSSMMLARIGRYDEALAQAGRCRALTAGRGLVENDMFANAAEAIATWRLRRDPMVLDRVSTTLRMAEELHHIDMLAILQDIEVEILWSIGRFDDARRTLEHRLQSARNRISDEQRVRWAHVQLGVDHRRVAALSTTDPLTGLRNRRYLDRNLPELVGGKRDIAVALIDLDGFKQVNDRHSYALGDSVIREIGVLLESACRRDDIVARLGGDEFVMVLLGADADEAWHVLDRFRVTVEHHRFDGVPDDLPLSASIGVVSLRAGSGRPAAEVLAAANAALHHSKRSGRNRITRADDM